MSPDRTAPTSLRPAPAPRSAAPGAPADGFAALLGAADKAAGARREPAASERGLERRRAGEVLGHDDSRHPARGRADAGRSAEHAAPHEPVDPTAAPLEPSVPVAPPVGAVPPTAAPEPVAPADLAPLAVPVDAAGPLAAPAATVEPAAPVEPAATLTTAPVPPAVAPLAAQPQASVSPAATAPSPAAPTEPALPAATTSPFAAPASAATAASAATGLAPAAVEAGTAAPAAPAAPTVTTAPAAEQAPAAPTALAQPAANGQGAGQQGSAPREQPTAGDDAPAPVAPAPVPSTPTAPAAAPAPPVSPLAQRSAPLHLAPRAVAQMLHVAVERGISHARLNLRPAELGGIEIRLQTSAAGVTAQVVADSPEAARLLQQAADDLRRSLERHDVTLLSLDVSTAGDDGADGSTGASADPAAERERHFAAHGLTKKAAEADEPPTVVETVQLNDGLHIDVLA